MIKQNLVSFFVKYLEEVGTTLSAEPPDSQYLRKPKNIQILKCNDLRFLDKTVRLFFMQHSTFSDVRVVKDKHI